jgi:tRNA threonylcarbamoyladenosine biosynthesis protein TsaB
MLILALDTSSECGSVALLRDAVVLAQEASAPEEPYSSSLLRQARALLDRAQISFERIDLLAVTSGPGSFTGLRVGLTTVKGWAEVWGIRIAAVSGLEAMAAQVADSSAPGSLVAAVMDARRGQVFGGVFRCQAGVAGGVERVGEEILAAPDEFAAVLRGHSGTETPSALACFDPGLIQAAMERPGLGCRMEIVSPVLAPFVGQLGYAKALRGDLVDALHLDANYIRRSDAEMNWRVDKLLP